MNKGSTESRRFNNRRRTHSIFMPSRSRAKNVGEVLCIDALRADIANQWLIGLDLNGCFTTLPEDRFAGFECGEVVHFRVSGDVFAERGTVVSSAAKDELRANIAKNQRPQPRC